MTRLIIVAVVVAGAWFLTSFLPISFHQPLVFLGSYGVSLRHVIVLVLTWLAWAKSK